MFRYARQTALPEIGTEGQRHLAAARVLIVGIGGLGSPIALYLAAAGIGHLGLCDADTVSLTNLQRQILYTEAEIGQPKTTCAARRLHALNSEIDITEHPTRLTPDNAEQIITPYDYIIDGCDNFTTRYLIDDTCSRLKKTYIYGAITDFTDKSPSSTTTHTSPTPPSTPTATTTPTSAPPTPPPSSAPPPPS